MCDNGPSMAVLRVNGLSPETLLPEDQEKFANDVHAFIKPHLDVGDRLVKVASCRQHYSAVLLESGSLLLFCPEVPSLHGSIVESGGELVVDVGAGESHVVFCTESGSVYTFGYCNRYGQLGDGSLWKGEETPGKIPRPLSEPKRIPCFGEDYNDVTLNNEEYLEDADAACQKNIPTESEPINHLNDDSAEDVQPIMKPSTDKDFGTKKRFVRGDISYEIKMKGRYPECGPVKIGSVACGLHHTLLMSAKRNSVYACGRGHCGQLSGKRAIPVLASSRIIRLLFGLPIRSITAAGHHSIVLLSTGKLLAFGENSCGQLGIGHCNKVLAPTSASFLPENRLFAAAFKVGGVSAASKRLQDAKMYSTLRAAYSSYEATYYPMKVERIDAELAPDEPFIIEVWTCETITIALTSELKWMSCGLPLSRFTGSKSKSNSGTAGRFDGFGVLGRPLMTKEESYSFGSMHFSSAIRDKIRESGYVFQSSAVEGNDVVPFPLAAEQRLECFCFPHSTVVKVPGPSTQNGGWEGDDDAKEQLQRGPATIFLQSNVVNSLVQLRQNGSSSVDPEDETPYFRACTLQKPDNEAAIGNFVLRGKKEAEGSESLDDDSCSFRLNPSTTVLPFPQACVLI